MVKNWIVDRSTAHDFTVIETLTYYRSLGQKLKEQENFLSKLTDL